MLAPFGRNFLAELNCFLLKLVFRRTQDAEGAAPWSASNIQNDQIRLQLYSFRIESDDDAVNELWTRTEDGWKLHFQKEQI